MTDAIRRPGGRYDYTWKACIASPERDGTLNDPRDTDEEWVIEMAVPFEALGMQGEAGETIGLALRRCDTPKGSSRVCRSWGDGPDKARIVLD